MIYISNTQPDVGLYSIDVNNSEYVDNIKDTTDILRCLSILINILTFSNISSNIYTSLDIVTCMVF